jgi:hypothetical protein
VRAARPNLHFYVAHPLGNAVLGRPSRHRTGCRQSDHCPDKRQASMVKTVTGAKRFAEGLRRAAAVPRIGDGRVACDPTKEQWRARPETDYKPSASQLGCSDTLTFDLSKMYGLGVVRGTVQDASSAIIRNAKVTLKNTGTSLVFDNRTNAAGISLYSFFQNHIDSVAYRFPNGSADFCLHRQFVFAVTHSHKRTSK